MSALVKYTTISSDKNALTTILALHQKSVQNLWQYSLQIHQKRRLTRVNFKHQSRLCGVSHDDARNVSNHSFAFFSNHFIKLKPHKKKISFCVY